VRVTVATVSARGSPHRTWRAICDHDAMASADRPRDPLLGEWACLGVLYDRPAHGWAIVKRLRPDGDIGRIWHLSRPLTYRALDQLATRGWVHPVGEEPGAAGPNRIVLAATRTGRARFRRWLQAPVPHLRDLRSELLLKLVFAEHLGVDVTDMLDRQRAVVEEHARTLAASLADTGAPDVVAIWRFEMTDAARRFLDQVHATRRSP
jgi:DNA-binding PadR family transcriptional regulator